MNEYNVLQSMFPNFDKQDFERIIGYTVTLDNFCAKVGSYMVARAMFPNAENPLRELSSARQKERQLSMREPQVPNPTTGNCCGGGQVK